MNAVCNFKRSPYGKRVEKSPIPHSPFPIPHSPFPIPPCGQVLDKQVAHDVITCELSLIQAGRHLNHL